MHCTNTAASVALSGTFSLAQNTTRFGPPGHHQNPELRRANTRGVSWENTDSAAVEDSAKDGVENGPQAVAEDSTRSDLTELDTEEREVDEADNVTEEEEDEGSEEQTVSSKDIEHSVIVVAPRSCGGKIRF